MNILMLTYQGDIAGSTLSISYLSKALAEKGHKVYVGCRKESLLAGYFEGTKVQVIPMTFKSKVDLKNAWHIRKICMDYKIDIINAQSSYDRYTSIFAKKLFGIKAKIVFTRRQRSRSLRGPTSWFYHWGTDKIVGVSNQVRLSLLKNGIPESKLTVIYNGTPKYKYDLVTPEKVEALRSKLGLKKEDFVIGCISRLKRQEQILEALKYIEQPLVIIFVGISHVPDFDITPLEHLGHRVIFMGTLSPEQSLLFYPLMDIKILAAVSEGLSQALLEAMYLNVPIIATAACGNLDLIQHEVNGLLFENKDSKAIASMILRMKENPTLRKRLAKNAKHTVKNKFSIERTRDEFEKLFESLLDQN